MISATVSGHLGRDAELARTNSGTEILKFTIASTGFDGKDKTTTWVACAMFGARGTKLAPHLTKGTPVVVRGSLSSREYEGQKGKGFSLDLRVDDIELMGRRDGGERAEPAQRPATEERPPDRERPAGSRVPATPPPADDFGSDEIPF